MSGWRSTLDADSLRFAELLELRGCRFAWREEGSLTSRAEPEGTSPIWFEIWQRGRLMDFAGPLEQPLGTDGVHAVKFLIAEYVNRLRISWG